MKKLLKAFLILLFLAVALAVGFGYGRWYSTRAASTKDTRRVLYYLDAMHPWYRSDKPGIAPDCGMKLTPVYSDGTQGSPDDSQSADTAQAAARQQLIGVRYEQAAWSTPLAQLRAVGRVTADETRTTRVQARTDGWIDTVVADFVGKYIGKGEPLLTFYSPELVAGEQEFLLAIKANQVMQASSMHDSATNSRALLEATRRRLELLRMTPAQIDEVERTNKSPVSITLFSPGSGYILARNAFPGQRITAETELYTLADLSQVWVIADVFEADAARVHVGQSAHVSFARSGRGTLNAKVSYIQPQIDAATHTLKVRIVLENPDWLRPDMYADVEFDTEGARKLMVPAEAVLDGGTSKTIFIDAGDGRFVKRAVEIGERIGESVEILSGLKAGERYAASGVFLLDSESQLKAAGK